MALPALIQMEVFVFIPAEFPLFTRFQRNWLNWKLQFRKAIYGMDLRWLDNLSYGFEIKEEAASKGIVLLLYSNIPFETAFSCFVIAALQLLNRFYGFKI